jgi:hypothetical protein
MIIMKTMKRISESRDILFTFNEILFKIIGKHRRMCLTLEEELLPLSQYLVMVRFSLDWLRRNRFKSHI